MKDTQHTPGPWKTGGCGEDGWRMILGPKTRFYHAFGESHTTYIATVSVSDCESEDLANARLIAAAPHLLPRSRWPLMSFPMTPSTMPRARFAFPPSPAPLANNNQQFRQAMNYAFEREEEILAQEFASGELSLQEYNKAMRDLAREAMGEAEEAAEKAYRETLENW